MTRVSSSLTNPLPAWIRTGTHCRVCCLASDGLCSRQEVWRLIQQLKQDHVVFLTTHMMEEANRLADQIAILAKGELQCVGSPLELKVC